MWRSVIIFRSQSGWASKMFGEHRIPGIRTSALYGHTSSNGSPTLLYHFSAQFYLSRSYTLVFTRAAHSAFYRCYATILLTTQTVQAKHAMYTPCCGLSRSWIIWPTKPEVLVTDGIAQTRRYHGWSIPTCMLSYATSPNTTLFRLLLEIRVKSSLILSVKYVFTFVWGAVICAVVLYPLGTRFTKLGTKMAARRCHPWQCDFRVISLMLIITGERGIKESTLKALT